MHDYGRWPHHFSRGLNNDVPLLTAHEASSRLKANLRRDHQSCFEGMVEKKKQKTNKRRKQTKTKVTLYTSGGRGGGGLTMVKRVPA